LNRRLECAAAVLLFGAAAAADVGQREPVWPNTFLARVEALAVLETLNAELLSHDSATVTLEHWCGEHRLAAPARVVAMRVDGIDKAPSADQRRELNVPDSEPVRYRRVRLSCGATVLSEADNWYVPSRLTAEMNKQLETTDTPFGKVVQQLRFRRRTLTAELLWHPLPVGWEMSGVHVPDGSGTLAVPAQVLEHRALLTLADGTPVSEVIESYTGNVLGFAFQSSPN
jgi:chorismate-pyruvate lyase